MCDYQWCVLGVLYLEYYQHLTAISLIRRRRRIVAAATMCGAQTPILIITTDAHWAISRPAHVLRLVSMADSRTKSLCVLLSASIMPICITHTYLFHPPLLSTAFQRNKGYPRILAALRRTATKIVVWLKKYGMCLVAECASGCKGTVLMVSRGIQTSKIPDCQLQQISHW